MTQRAVDASPAMLSFRGSRNVDMLETLLDAGWRIDPPVLARLAWAQRSGGERAYHFIMERDNQRSLVVIDDGPEIRRFLERHSLTPQSGVRDQGSKS